MIQSDDHYGRRDQVRPGEPRGDVPKSPRGRSTEAGRPGARHPRGRTQEPAGAYAGQQPNRRRPTQRLWERLRAVSGLLGCARPCVCRTHNTRVPPATLADRESQFSQTHFHEWSDPQDFSSPSWPMSPARSGGEGGRNAQGPPRKAENPCAMLEEESRVRWHGQDT